MASHNRGIGHRKNWRRIDQHQVVVRTPPLQQFAKALPHQQFRRVRRDLSARNEVKVGNRRFLRTLFNRRFAHQHIRQAVIVGGAEQFVGVALTHIAVNHQHALVGLANHRREVGADEGFTDGRTHAGHHQHIVLRLHHGEVQTGAQATNRLNGEVSRVTHRQQLALLIALHAVNALHAIAGFLPFRKWNAGVNVNTMFFQHLRAFDTAVKQRAQQYADNRQHQAKNNAAKHNQRFLRFYHARLGNRRVNDTHVAHGARLGDFQLLLFVQQLHIHLLAGLHVTGQAHNFLLGFWHRGDALAQLRLLFFQRTTFLQQRAVRRVNFGVELGDFSFAEGQFIQLGIDVHHRVEYRFCFQRQVDGVFLLTVGVQLVFSNIKLATYLRELDFKKLQALCRLFGFTRNVLRHVVAGNAVEDFADLVFVFPHHGQRQHAGVFTIFGNTQAILQGIDHPQGRVFGDRKAGPFIGGNPRNH